MELVGPNLIGESHQLGKGAVWSVLPDDPVFFQKRNHKS